MMNRPFQATKEKHSDEGISSQARIRCRCPPLCSYSKRGSQVDGSRKLVSEARRRSGDPDTAAIARRRLRRASSGCASGNLLQRKQRGSICCAHENSIRYGNFASRVRLPAGTFGSVTMRSARQSSVLIFAALAFMSAPISLRAQALTPHQQLARDIHKELVEINTVTATGDTLKAAQAMADRLKAAGFPDADVRVLSPAPRKGNLVARLRGTGARKPILLLAHLDEIGRAHV